MSAPQLAWLPEPESWREEFARASEGDFAAVLRLAHSRLDFVRTNALDHILRRWPARPEGWSGRSHRLALLSSSTCGHLIGALRIAALRARIWLDVYAGEYGQYRQELGDPQSALHGFRPDAVLLAFDAERLAAGVTAAASSQVADRALEAVRADLVGLWRQARAAGWAVLQQTALPAFPALTGSNEHRLPGSRAAFLARLNAGLRPLADAEGVDLVALDAAAARDGLAAWRDPALWARAKQEIRPAAAPMWGELVARVLAARLGLTRKCLALDLDNTLWGGVIGDDGLDGIVLGHGSALGEGFLAVQDYARELSRRGVILAVCSKNDEANALEPFEKHPDMKLRRDDIACFVANWDDKAQNLRRIADRLNIGVDSLVFVDDNPFERGRVREALPMVAVPEIPDEPALIPDALAAAGYFETVDITGEDRARAAQYRGNDARETERASHADLGDYLRSLQMRASWGRFDAINRARVVQLINKTNQFNLTTRRYGEADHDAIRRDPAAFGAYVRLIDRFGDNGLIAVVIARHEGSALVIEAWLMSCRVLGREVEAATLAILVAEARRRGAERLIGEYIPSPKNALVRDHYDRLGFQMIGQEEAGRRRYALRIEDYAEPDLLVAIAGADCGEASADSRRTDSVVP